MLKILDLSIPARHGAEATTLHIEIDCQPNDTRPVIFTLPGGPGASGCKLYQTHTAALADQFQLVYWDPRGCGLSAHGNPKNYNTKNYINDVEYIRHYLQQQYGEAYAKVIILGTSYGGMAACEYATQYPNRISHLILVATAASYHFYQQAWLNLKKIANQDQLAAFDTIANGKLTSVEHAQLCFKLLAPLYSLKTAEQLKHDPDALGYFTLPGYGWEFCNNEFTTFMRTFNTLPALAHFKAPTLILGADKDWVCDIRGSETIANTIPHATLVCFENCGHSIAVDNNALYLHTIRTFLNQ